MAEVIEFPRPPRPISNLVEGKVEQVLRGTDPAVADCIRSRMAEITAKYRKMTAGQVRVDLPPGMDAPTGQALVDQITEQHDATHRAFVDALFADLISAEAALCELRTRRNRQGR